MAEGLAGVGQVEEFLVPAKSFGFDKACNWRTISRHLYTTSGRGSVAASFVWLALMAHRIPGSREVFVSNADLAKMICLPCHDVAVALRILDRAGHIKRACGEGTVGGLRRSRRVILMPTTSGPVIIPEREDIEALFDVCRALRERPATLAIMIIGAYTIIATDRRAPIVDEWVALPCNMADLRRFVGAKKTAAWPPRIRTLVSVGMFRREGHQLTLAPPCLWNHVSLRAAQSHRPPGP